MSLQSWRRSWLAPLVMLVALVGAAHAQKVKVEYDKSLDFSKFKTYAIDPHADSARPMLRLAIQGAIEEDLQKRGLTRSADNPDLYIQMYGATDTDFSVGYSDMYYGSWIPPFDYGYVMWTAAPGPTTTVIVKKGTLIVDILDAHQKRLIWRGIAKAKLSDQKEKMLEQVNTAVEKMLAQYPVKK